jgi:hypothetical protein
MIAPLGNRDKQTKGETTMTKTSNKGSKASPAKKATKKTAPKKEAGQFREGSFLAQLHDLLTDGQPHKAEDIVAHLKAQKHLINRTASSFVGGFRAGLKKAGYTLTSTDQGYVMTQAKA